MVNTDDSNSPRERILSFVEHRISGRGLAGLSVEEIAAALGMSKKTFYKIFPNKEAMLEELIGRIVGDVSGQIEGIARSDRNFIEKISGLMNLLGPVYRKLAIPLSENLYRTAPSVWSRVEEFRHRKIQSVFSMLLDQGIAEGFIEQDVNRTVFMLSYLAAIRDVINPRVLVEHPISAVDAMEQIIRIFFAGIMTADGREALADLRTKQLSQTT